MTEPPSNQINTTNTFSSSQDYEHLVELRDVDKAYKIKAGDFLALKNINLTIDAGEFVGVVGKSGSGKSTLVNMITGIDRPTGGEIHVAGTPIHLLNEGQMAKWRGRNQGVVFQFFQLLPTLLVIENVTLPMALAGMYKPRERRERAMELLDLVDVADQANKLPSAISGGQQQRVAIARALANDPPMIIADEPTGNLDSRTANQVFELFEQLMAAGKTFLIVTHDDELAKRVSRTVVIADGEIVNEWLAKALPTLSQDGLVRTNRRLTSVGYSPGEPIIREGSQADIFHIITQGEVSMYLKPESGDEVCVRTLGPGQYFGEMALLNGGQRMASVRAASTSPVQVVTLSQDEFHEMLKGSEETREAIELTVAERSQLMAAL